MDPSGATKSENEVAKDSPSYPFSNITKKGVFDLKWCQEGFVGVEGIPS